MADTTDDVERIAYGGEMYAYAPIAETAVPPEIRHWGLPYRYRGKHRAMQFGSDTIEPTAPGATYMRIINLGRAGRDADRVAYYRLV